MNYRATICMIAMMLTGNAFGLMKHATGSRILEASRNALGLIPCMKQVILAGCLGGFVNVGLKLSQVRTYAAYEKNWKDACKEISCLDFYQKYFSYGGNPKEYLHYQVNEAQLNENELQWFKYWSDEQDEDSSTKDCVITGTSNGQSRFFTLTLNDKGMNEFQDVIRKEDAFNGTTLTIVMNKHSNIVARNLRECILRGKIGYGVYQTEWNDVVSVSRIRCAWYKLYAHLYYAALPAIEGFVTAAMAASILKYF